LALLNIREVLFEEKKVTKIVLKKKDGKHFEIND